MCTAFFRLKKVGRRDGQKAESCPEGTLRRGHERRNSLNYNFLNGGGKRADTRPCDAEVVMPIRYKAGVALFIVCAYSDMKFHIYTLSFTKLREMAG